MDEGITIPPLLGNSTPTRDAPRNVLSQQEFLNIMISELTNQDPLEPLDNQQFLNQLTQIQTLQATTELTEGIQALLLGQQISSAGTLIGQSVNGIADDGTTVEGLVDRVLVEDGRVLLRVGDATVPLTQVREVFDGEDNT